MRRAFQLRSGSGVRSTTAGLAVGMLALLASCSSGGGTPIGATLSCNSPGPVSGLIRLQCGAVVGDEVTVTAVLGGGGLISDMYTVLFDIVFDNTRFEFVEGSVTAGSLFGAGPNLPTAELSSTDPSRVLVAISLQGAVPGVPGPPSDTSIVSVVFRALGPEGSHTPLFENEDVLNSSGASLGLVFLDGIQLVMQ